MLQYLKTPAGPGWSPVRDRKVYVLWIVLIWVGMIAGFLPDMARYFGESPHPPLILNVHAAVYFLWLALVAVQIALIEIDKPDLHRRLGWALAVVSAAMVPLGLIAAMVDQARQLGHRDFAPEFLALEFQSMLLFPAFLATGILLRRDLAAHKRLMILAAITILDPGTARAFANFSPWKPTGIFGWWLSYFWANELMVAAMVCWDMWQRGKPHPTLLVGALLIAAGEAAAVVFQFSPWWHNAMVRLVTMWAWTG